jgi:hypothetical protein
MKKKAGNTARTSRRDRDGWLVDAKTGALIGPDPEIERELTDEDLKHVRVMGRPRLPEDQRRQQIAMRWAPDTIKALKARGPHWSNWAEAVIERALSNPNFMVKRKKKVAKKVGGVALHGRGRSSKKRRVKRAG